MINLIRAEFYQLTLRKAPKIWLLAAFIFSLLVVFVYYSQFWYSLGNRPELQSLAVRPLISFIYIPLVRSTAIFFIIGLSNTAFHDEIKNRTFINTLSAGHTRTLTYLSKLFSALLMASAFIFVSFIAFTLSGKILLSGDLSIYIELLFKGVLLDNFPIWLMYLALFLLIYSISSSNIMMNILIIILISFPLVLELLAFSFDFVATIKPYIFTQLNANDPLMIGELNATPWIAIAYFLFFTSIGLILFNRKEIK